MLLQKDQSKVMITAPKDPKEVLACKQMYESFDDKNNHISDHAHDKDLSINNFIKFRNGTTNMNQISATDIPNVSQ